MPGSGGAGMDKSLFSRVWLCLSRAHGGQCGHVGDNKLAIEQGIMRQALLAP